MYHSAAGHVVAVDSVFQTGLAHAVLTVHRVVQVVQRQLVAVVAEVYHRHVGVAAHLQAALAGIAAENLGRILAQHLRHLLQRKALVPAYLVEHQAEALLNAGHAADDLGEVLHHLAVRVAVQALLLHPAGEGAVVRGDKTQCAIDQSLPQGVLILLTAQRRAHEIENAVLARVFLLGQRQIVGAGLGDNVHAPLLGLADGLHSALGGDMEEVDGGFQHLRIVEHTAHGLLLAHGGLAAGEILPAQGVVPAEQILVVLGDGVALGVEAAAAACIPGSGQDLQHIHVVDHHVGLAVGHKQLEGGDAVGDHLGDLVQMGLDLTVHHSLGLIDLSLRGGLVRRRGLLQCHLGVH